MAQFVHLISAVDAHTAGEPARVVLGGIPALPGATMAAKKHYLARNLDHLRTLLMHEPRGHKDMFGVILVPPVTEQADYGILFMDGDGYIDMCGHSVMAATTVLIETGAVQGREPETTIVFDTPAGRVESRARLEQQRVLEVSISNVPCFLYQSDVEIILAGRGKIAVDIAFGGNFFALVAVERLGLKVAPEHSGELIRLGMAVREAVNRVVSVRHPTLPHITRVALTEIYEKPDPGGFAKSTVVFGQGQLDRCPCGTGTSAAMARLYARGELALGAEFINQSIIGTRFTGCLRKETRVGDFSAVEVRITGQSYLTGIQQFVVDSEDPLKYGFRMD